MSQIKLIWDFRGQDAEEMARHHVRHLEEFSTREKMVNTNCGCSSVQDKHWTAWMIVPEEKMIAIRDALRPHRGQRLG